MNIINNYLRHPQLLHKLLAITDPNPKPQDQIAGIQTYSWDGEIGDKVIERFSDAIKRIPGYDTASVELNDGNILVTNKENSQTYLIEHVEKAACCCCIGCNYKLAINNNNNPVDSRTANAFARLMEPTHSKKKLHMKWYQIYIPKENLIIQ